MGRSKSDASPFGINLARICGDGVIIQVSGDTMLLDTVCLLAKLRPLQKHS